MTRRFITTALFLTIFLSCSVVSAESLNFKQVLAAALDNANSLKIAREDIQIGRYRLDESKADYYPQLSLRLGNEYVYAFDDNNGVVSVGDTISTSNESSYKHSLVFGLSYNLFDFGIRKLTVENARRQVEIAGLQEQQSLWEVRRAVLDFYATGLKQQKQLQATKTVLERQNSNYRLLKQLRDAGTVGQEQVGSAALAVAETLSRLDELKLGFTESLGSLTVYTGKNYQPDTDTLSDFAQPDRSIILKNIETLPEVAIYQQQIESKKNELSMVKRSLLPRLTFQGAYRLYGSDQDSFAHSLAEVNSRDVTATIYLEWPLFSGFESRAKMQRIKHEMNRLGYQKQQKVAELQLEQTRIYSAYEAHKHASGKRHEQLALIEQETSTVQRLAAQQLKDRVAFHNRMIELTRQQLEVELRRVDYVVSAVALDIMQEAAL